MYNPKFSINIHFPNYIDYSINFNNYTEEAFTISTPP